MVGIIGQLLLSQAKFIPPGSDSQTDLAAYFPLFCLIRTQQKSVIATPSGVCPQKVVFRLLTEKAKSVCWEAMRLSATLLISFATVALLAPASCDKQEPEPQEKAVPDENAAETFMAVLKAAGVGNELVTKVSTKGRTVSITVANGWHYQPKQVRQQNARILWQTWAMIYAPNDSDKARLSLLDSVGHEVGGSRLLGGSLIWVAD